MNAAIYIRKSREEKDKPSHRLTVQREQLPAYAQAQGWTYQVYDDGHASAARGKTEDLQERSRLETDIRAGRIGVILCIELSRLSRDESLQDYVAWLQLCADHNVKLATPGRLLDPAQHSEWMILIIEGGFSSVEMKILKGRMKDGYDQAFREGRFLGGTPPPPYIYDAKLKKPVIDPESLPQMQKLWQLAETHSAKSIATQLNMPEIAVRRAISDDRLLWYQSLRIDPSTGEEITCEWQPCMTAEQASCIRAGRRSKTKNAARKEYSALLSNLKLLYCGYCGRTVKVWHNSRIRQDGTRNDYYGCQTKNDKDKCPKARLIPQWLLNDRILTNLFNTLADLDQLKGHWLATQQATSPEKELVDLGKKITREKDRKQRLVNAITDGVIEFADAKQKMTEINRTIDTLETDQRQILSTISQEPDWDLLSFTQEEFTALQPDDQRTLLTVTIERIDLYENYGIITYPFPRNSQGERTARIKLPLKQDGYIKR